MNSRAFTLSLVIAGLAVFVGHSYLASREAEFVKAYQNSSPVVIAKVDINEYEIIDDSKLEIVTIPAKFQMPGHFKKIEELYNTIAAVPIKTGEQITRPRITYPGSQTGLARQVSVGKRALAIPISDSKAVAKLIKPGDRVDLLALIDYSGGKKDKIKIKTILQDALVLSTGLFVTNSIPIANIASQNGTREVKLNTYTDYNTITLELTPFEVQKVLWILANTSNYYFSLRNNDDKTIERISGTKIFDVLGEDAPEAKAHFAEQLAREKQRAAGGGGGLGR
jgi:pilus assembly protein CpaB